jgi:hypothetical protein
MKKIMIAVSQKMIVKVMKVIMRKLNLKKSLKSKILQINNNQLMRKYGRRIHQVRMSTFHKSQKSLDQLRRDSEFISHTHITIKQEKVELSLRSQW